MNILDINTLPTLTLNVTGREGDGTSVTVINQESKDSIQLTNFTYTQGDTLVLTIEDQSFLDTLEQDTTLSVILYNNKIPLYRDVVRFRGELNLNSEYLQYDNGEDDYFVYTGGSTAILENANFSSYGENLMTSFTANNENSSFIIEGTEDEPFLTISGSNTLDGVTVNGLDNLEAGRMYRIVMNLTYTGTDRGYVNVSIGGRSFAYNTLQGSGFTTYVYAEESDLSMSVNLRIGNDAADFIVSHYSIQALEGWKVSGENAGSYIKPVTDGFSRRTFGDESTVSLSTLTSDSALLSGVSYELTANVIDLGAGMDILQGETVLGTISQSGAFSLSFDAVSNEGISFRYPNSTNEFIIKDISLQST